nr:QFDBD-2xQFAD*-VP16*-EcR [Expression vector pQFDBD-2x AD*-VP16*-EcR, alpha-cry:EGFP]UIN24817.1 QFDBD-2xAD*-VP16*-EcR [Expression vector pubb-QFDBD-2x AD*-VP16*-EcR, alpha-cryEGFP]WNN25230.1 IQ-Switch Driver [Vector pSIQ]
MPPKRKTLNAAAEANAHADGHADGNADGHVANTAASSNNARFADLTNIDTPGLGPTTTTLLVEPARSKRQRVSRACDQCRAAREKCDGIQPACFPCVSQGRSCTYQASPKKRGVQTGYIRTLELALAWMFENVARSEDALHNLLVRDAGQGSALLVGKDSPAAERLHARWATSRVNKSITRLLSGQAAQDPSEDGQSPSEDINVQDQAAQDPSEDGQSPSEDINVQDEFLDMADFEFEQMFTDALGIDEYGGLQMRPECVIQEPSKNKDRQRQKKDKGILLPVSTTTVEDHMPPIMQCDPPPPEAARIHEVVPRYLSEKLMEQNRQKNIPPLSANQKSLIARLVWYQEGYEQPSDEDLKRVTQTWQSDEEDEESDLPFRQITEMTILTVQLIVEFAKGLPGFSKISQSDQITLLKASSSEVMMLRVARRYDAASDSILFANNKAYTRDNYRKAGMAEVIEDLLHFCRCMFAMGMDNVHFALLTAIVIFSDRPGLEQPSLVEEIQRYYLNTLRIYIINQNSASSRCAVIYGRILSVLTELRTLGTQNSNMCISLKLKNRKLPPFLEEIWDVAEVATTHPTVLPPTNPVVL